MRDCGGAERALSHSADAHDGAVGQARIHPHPAQATRHAEAALRPRQAQVRVRLYYSTAVSLR